MQDAILTPDSRKMGVVFLVGDLKKTFRKYSTNPKSLVYFIENLMLVSNQLCGITGVQWLSSYSWYYHSTDLFSSRFSVVLNNEYLLPRRFNNDNFYTYIINSIMLVLYWLSVCVYLYSNEVLELITNQWFHSIFGFTWAARKWL